MVAQAGLKLVVQPRMTLDICAFYFRLSNVEIVGVRDYSLFCLSVLELTL